MSIIISWKIQLQLHLLKYNDCQISLFCDEYDTSPQYNVNNISYKNEITISESSN